MPRPKGSADLLEHRRRRALALLGEGRSLHEVARLIACAASSVSTSPAFKNLCVIQYSGIPSGGSAIPSGAIAIFDDTVAAANWSDYSATFGTNYLRGNSTAGGTGGCFSSGSLAILPV